MSNHLISTPTVLIIQCRDATLAFLPQLKSVGGRVSAESVISHDRHIVYPGFL